MTKEILYEEDDSTVSQMMVGKEYERGKEYA